MAELLDCYACEDEQDIYNEQDDLFTADWTPAVDVQVSARAYEIRMELPGVKRSDIAIDFAAGKLLVSGTKHAQLKLDHDTWRQNSECVYGAFCRRFLLSEIDDPKKIQACFHEGILKISAPRKTGGSQTFLAIEIE